MPHVVEFNFTRELDILHAAGCRIPDALYRLQSVPGLEIQISGIGNWTRPLGLGDVFEFRIVDVIFPSSLFTFGDSMTLRFVVEDNEDIHRICKDFPLSTASDSVQILERMFHEILRQATASGDDGFVLKLVPRIANMSWLIGVQSGSSGTRKVIADQVSKLVLRTLGLES
jgi:hypothetical protein